MPEKWSEFVQAMEDRESWLAATVEKEGDGSCDTASLLATAALVRGAVNAPEVTTLISAALIGRAQSSAPIKTRTPGPGTEGNVSRDDPFIRFP